MIEELTATQIKFIKGLLLQKGMPEADFEFSEKIKLTQMSSTKASELITKLQKG